MLRIEEWRIKGTNGPPGYAWNQPSELRLENNTWSRSAVRWTMRPSGLGGTMSAGNSQVFQYPGQPQEIRLELDNLASEAVGVFVRRTT